MLSLVPNEGELPMVEEEIKSFILEQVNGAGASGAVVGLSGGIDSSLSAKLAVSALGKEKVLLAIMPERGVTPGRDEEEALELARALGARKVTIEIGGLVRAFLDSFPFSELGGDEHLAIANLKPRIRMSLLYMLANMEKLLVMGTGNRTELLLGYFTKYGDGGVDFLPLGGLYKTQVRALAKHVGLPSKLIEKPPSAGLWRGQTDEGELGMSYSTIDEVLHSHLDSGLSSDEIAEKLEISKSRVRKILELVEKSKHKRALPRIKEFF